MPPDRALRPADAVAAIRSFPRRFRGVLARPDDDEAFDPDEIGRRIGPDGTSAADHLLAADGVLALLDGSLEEVRRHDPGPGSLVTVHPAFADLGDVSWEDPHSPMGDLLDQFEATANRASDAVDAVATEQWASTVQVAGGSRSLTLIEAVQDAVGVVSDHLRAAQRVVEAVR